MIYLPQKYKNIFMNKCILSVMYVDVPCIPTWAHITQHKWTVHIFVITWIYSDVLHWLELASVLMSCNLPILRLRWTGTVDRDWRIEHPWYIGLICYETISGLKIMQAHLRNLLEVKGNRKTWNPIFLSIHCKISTRIVKMAYSV